MSHMKGVAQRQTYRELLPNLAVPLSSTELFLASFSSIVFILRPTTLLLCFTLAQVRFTECTAPTTTSFPASW